MDGKKRATTTIRVAQALSVLMLVSGVTLLGGQVWLELKARLAGLLIERAFAASLADGRSHPPWSWADMHPIASLEVPRLGIRRIVLSGASGESMAFGPGHIDGTAAPGMQGNCGLAGHRDTWFSFLEDLEAGDELQVSTRRGLVYYVVEELRVVSMGDDSVLEPSLDTRLTLVTCYPFSGVWHSPWRYVVVARKRNGPSTHRRKHFRGPGLFSTRAFAPELLSVTKPSSPASNSSG